MNEPIINKPIRSKSVEKKYYNDEIEIPVDRVVHVPVPVVAKIPIFMGTQISCDYDGMNCQKNGSNLDSLAQGNGFGGFDAADLDLDSNKGNGALLIGSAN